MSSTEDRDGLPASSEPPGPDHDRRSDEDPEARQPGFVARQVTRSGRWAATTAASTVLAAALISGSGATAAVAGGPSTVIPEDVQAPRAQGPHASAAATDGATATGEVREQRAAAVAAELSDAVAHGDVTQEQADAFLAKLLPRMADG